MNIKKLQAILLMTALLFVVSSAGGDDYKRTLTLTIASADPVYDETYTLTVPDDFTITKSGWNQLGSLTANYSGTKDGFNPSKKLVITVTSTHTSGNNFYLASKTTGVTDTVSYYLATSENDAGSTTTFEFAASEITTEGTSKTIGVNVEDYSSKAAGDYEDEITYSVAVQNALITVTWNNDDITGNDDDKSFTKDGVTIIASKINFVDKIFEGGTFTTTRGNFTKIEVTASAVNTLSGDGWTVSSNKATWTGNAESVSFNGTIRGDGEDVTFVFTIEPQSKPEGESEGGSDNVLIP